jgi:hypothetical protein
MPVKILRWKGGAGGDMILHLKSLSHPGSVVNVVTKNIGDDGKTAVDFSHIQHDVTEEILKITLYNWVELVDIEILQQEIQKLHSQNCLLWVKSHYYKTDFFNDITVDIVADPVSLPFLVASNIKKTETTTLDFNKLTGLIPDPQIKYNYATYCVAVDSLGPTDNVGSQKLLLSNIIGGYGTFKKFTDSVGLDINGDFEWLYNQWLEKNQQNLPSQQYQTMVKDKNYDFMNQDLSLFERYSLMALAGSKFVNLDPDHGKI